MGPQVRVSLGHGAKERRRPPDAGKDKETSSPQEPPEGAPHGPPRRGTLTSRKVREHILLFSPVLFVAGCSSRNRKRIHAQSHQKKEGSMV